MALAGINTPAAFAAAMAAWLVGAVWYMALAKPWATALGKTPEEIRAGASAAPFIIAFIAELVMAFVLAAFMVWLGPVNPRTGIAAGFFAWLGFVATSMAVNQRFSGARPMLTLIDGGHWLAVLLVEGAVIGAFGAMNR